VAVNEKAGLDRDALEDLRRDYAGIVRENLDFSHRYLNFYVGLNSALLAAMTAGLLGLEKGDRRGLWLLAGPLLMIALAGVGWVTVRVFYFRFVEGWVTVTNIEKMIGLRDSSVEVAEEMAEPLYKNAWGGFVAQFEDARVLSSGLVVRSSPVIAASSAARQSAAWVVSVPPGGHRRDRRAPSASA
jgi:hypothetical protein